MAFFPKVYNMFRTFYNEMNPATLTGAIDVIVVQHPDGSFHASPFHVRFGKIGVLHSRYKVVDITINGNPIEAVQMKLGESGEAFFVIEADESEDMNEELSTSPIPSRYNSPKLSPNLSIENDKLMSKMDENEAFSDNSREDEFEATRNAAIASTEVAMATIEEQSKPIDFDKVREKLVAGTIEIPNIQPSKRHKREHSADQVSFQDIAEAANDEQEEEMFHLELDQFEKKTSSPKERKISSPPLRFNSNTIVPKPKVSMARSLPDISTMAAVSKNSTFQDDNSSSDEDHMTSPRVSSSYQNMTHLRRKLKQMTITNEDELHKGYTSDSELCRQDILDRQIPAGQTEDIRWNWGELPASFDGTCSDSSKTTSNVPSANQNDSGYVTKLLGRFFRRRKENEKSGIRQTTGMYLKDLESLSTAQKEEVLGRPRTQSASCRQRSDMVASSNNQADSKDSGVASDSDGSWGSMEDLLAKPKQYKKTLRLNSEQLEMLQLNYGKNSVEFSVTTKYQGTTTARCSIYLWQYDEKIVISDIDGTITISDVLGHLAPMVGAQWAHAGVAQLYQEIKANGYQLLYLSSRAVGQSERTRIYLQKVEQEAVSLPTGPVMLSPRSLFAAFYTEVIERRPEEFKIQCLQDIRSLFPADSEPFFAGYGNRLTDFISYSKTGIPQNRIFIVNSKGELHQETFYCSKSSYNSHTEIVDSLYPPLKGGFDIFTKQVARITSPNTIDAAHSDRLYWATQFENDVEHDPLFLELVGVKVRDNTTTTSEKQVANRPATPTAEVVQVIEKGETLSIQN